MGLRHQHTACTLMDWNVGREDDAHSSAAEGKQINRCCFAASLFQLQPTLLWKAHGPILDLAACTSGAADVGHLVQGKHPAGRVCLPMRSAMSEPASCQSDVMGSHCSAPLDCFNLWKWVAQCVPRIDSQCCIASWRAATLDSTAYDHPALNPGSR
jgi:hypothetical protein